MPESVNASVEKSMNFRDGQFASLRFPSSIRTCMHLRIYYWFVIFIINCDYTIINSYFLENSDSLPAGKDQSPDKYRRDGSLIVRIRRQEFDFQRIWHCCRSFSYSSFSFSFSHYIPVKTSFGILVSDW